VKLEKNEREAEVTSFCYRFFWTDTKITIGPVTFPVITAEPILARRMIGGCSGTSIV
jgi:hypothetical protein